MGSSLMLVVAAGLAVGIAFVIVFSVLSSTLLAYPIRHLAYHDKIGIEIADMNDVYQVNEPISFTAHTKGASDNLCNYPKATAVISNSEDLDIVWSSPPAFQL